MFVIAAACLGVGLLAFVLGMRYGVTQNDGVVAVGSSGGDLDRLDRQAARLKAVRGQERTALSFHDSLSGPARAPRRPTPVASPIAPVVTPAPAQAPATAEPPPAASPQPAPQAPPPVAVTPAPESSAAPLAATAAAGEGPAGDEVGAGEEPEPATRFSLQVGAFPDAAAAETLAAKLTEKGYRVRIVSAEVEGKGTWYRVRVGAYDERSSAEQRRAHIADKEGLFALVVPER